MVLWMVYLYFCFDDSSVTFMPLRQKVNISRKKRNLMMSKRKNSVIRLVRRGPNLIGGGVSG